MTVTFLNKLSNSTQKPVLRFNFCFTDYFFIHISRFLTHVQPSFRMIIILEFLVNVLFLFLEFLVCETSTDIRCPNYEDFGLPLPKKKLNPVKLTIKPLPTKLFIEILSALSFRVVYQVPLALSYYFYFIYFVLIC